MIIGCHDVDRRQNRTVVYIRLPCQKIHRLSGIIFGHASRVDRRHNGRVIGSGDCHDDGFVCHASVAVLSGVVDGQAVRLACGKIVKIAQRIEAERAILLQREPPGAPRRSRDKHDRRATERRAGQPRHRQRIAVGVIVICQDIDGGSCVLIGIEVVECCIWGIVYRHHIHRNGRRVCSSVSVCYRVGKCVDPVEVGIRLIGDEVVACVAGRAIVLDHNSPVCRIRDAHQLDGIPIRVDEAGQEIGGIRPGVFCHCNIAIDCNGRIIGAGDRHDDIVHSGRAMRIGRGNLDHHVAGFSHRQVLEVGAGVEAERGAGDRGRALGRCAGHRIGQRGAIIIAVHIPAKRRKVDVNRGAVFGGLCKACHQSRRVIGPSDIDKHGLALGCPVSIGCCDRHENPCGFAHGQSFEGACGVEGKRRSTDGGDASSGAIVDRVGERRTIVVTIRIHPKRRQVQRYGRPIFGRRNRRLHNGRRIIGAGDRHDDIVHGRRAMRIGRGNLDHHVAGFTHRQVLEVGAGVEAERGAGDRGRALGRCAGHRIGQRGAIIIAVHIPAKRRKVDVNRRAVFNRRGSASHQCRRIIRAMDRDGDSFRGNATIAIVD